MRPEASKNRERERALPVPSLKEQGEKQFPESREYWRGVGEASLVIASMLI